jgi:hypothetical protein
MRGFRPSVRRLITQFADIILIKKFPTIGGPFPLGVDHEFGSSSTLDWPDYRPRSRSSDGRPGRRRPDARFTP